MRVEMGIPAVLVIVGAYLLGSIPVAFLVGRWLRGIDIRRYGSGTVSGSGVWEHVARWAVVPAGLLDVFKAALPTWLALQLDLTVELAVAAGLAAAVGHNWPVFLRFTGGRGLSCFLGVWLVVFPWGFPWLLGFLAAGWLLGDSAPWALAGLTTVPLCAHLTGEPTGIVAGSTGAMVILTLLKRLEANRRPLPPPGTDRRNVLWRRLIYDRDIASHRQWLDQKPGPESSQLARPRTEN